MHLKPNPEDNGQISEQFLNKLLKSDFKQYYTTRDLNDVLYLHYKGFQKITNLDKFTGLKVLYLEGNGIKKIEGLEKLTNLRCLYLQENVIKKIEGLENLENLVNMNLSDNMIEKIEGLGALKKLQNLQLKRNRIGCDGIDDLKGLLECPTISALDISDNKIQTEEIVPEILMKMPQLAVLYLQNNGFNKKIAHYRKVLITKIQGVKYIDDKPVFQDERRFAEAWVRGGIQEEKLQREKYRKQQEQQQLRQHREFQQMMGRYREEGRRQRQARERASENSSGTSENESDSKQENLQSYHTPEQSQNTSERASRNCTENSEASETGSQKPVSEKDKEEKIQEAPQIKDPKTYLDELD